MNAREPIHNAMNQWIKLEIGLELIKRQEEINSKMYTHIAKLRTDYYYSSPKFILRELTKSLNNPKTGLLGASDKVFAGRRDTFMVLEGYCRAMEPWFYENKRDFWPINIKQVIGSDESLKWYGMKWPKKIIGNPKSIRDMIHFLKSNRIFVEECMANHKEEDNSESWHLFKGDRKFASEVSFAQYLNFTGITFCETKALRGFLYSNRNLESI